MSKTLYFSLTEHSTFRQHSADMGSDFDTKHMQIGTLLNVSLER